MIDRLRLLLKPSVLYDRLKRRQQLRRLKKYIDRRQEAYPEIHDLIDRVLDAYHKLGGFEYLRIRQQWKLHSLYEELVEHQPKTILELGSGSTTAIISAYCKAHASQSISLDESMEWKRNTESIILDCDIKASGVEVEYADRKRDKDVVGIAHAYEYALAETFDMIIVDGPSVELDGEFDDSYYNSDVVDYLRRGFLPKVILVDNRKSTVKHIESESSNKYTIEYSKNWDFNDVELSSYNFYTTFVLLNNVVAGQPL